MALRFPDGVVGRLPRVALAVALVLWTLTGGIVGASAPWRQTAPDTIRGFVFDSLLRAPIAGATVVADPGSVTVTTTEDGRFTLIGAQPITQITVFHDVLDRTGIGSLTVRVTAETNRRQLVIATPSIATSWQRVCPSGAKFVEGREGIVFGAARTADGASRVAGARVRVTFDLDEYGLKNPALPRAVEGRTDESGGFYICGVPPLADVYLVAYSPEMSSGTLAIPADSMPLRKQDLVLGTATQTGVVRGVIRDPRRLPLANATVEVGGVDAMSATTDKDGRFQLSKVPAGSRTLLVRALGYTPVLQQLDVMTTGTDEVRLQLERAITLPASKITERKTLPPLIAGYEERKRVGFGTFMDSSVFKNRNNVRSIFQGAAGINVDGKTASEWDLYMSATTGWCHANIFLDGFKSDTRVLAAMNQEQIAAVEIYLRATEVPAKYTALNSTCGTVLVWTKSAFHK
jgi:hypothetical protein